MRSSGDELYNRKRKEIVSFLEETVSSKNITSVDQLSDADKDWLTALNIQSLAGTHDSFCCITDPDNADETLNLFVRALLTSKPEDHYDLLGCLKNNAFNYFKKPMNKLLQEVIDEIESRPSENPNDEYDPNNEDHLVRKQRYA